MSSWLKMLTFMSSPPWCGVIITSCYPFKTKGMGAIEFNPCMPGLGQSFCNITKVQRIIGIVERLRLRSSKRFTVNVIRNQQRNRITLDETNIASSQIMEYVFSLLIGLRWSFARTFSAHFMAHMGFMASEMRSTEEHFKKSANP